MATLSKTPIILWESANRLVRTKTDKGHEVLSFEEFKSCKVCHGDWEVEHYEHCPIPWLLEWSRVTSPENWWPDMRDRLDQLL